MAMLHSLIKQHNVKVFTDGKKPTRLCNCRYKDSCPLTSKCITIIQYTKQNLLPLTNVNSTMGHQMESSKLGLITIPAFLDTKGMQLILN